MSLYNLRNIVLCTLSVYLCNILISPYPHKAKLVWKVLTIYHFKMPLLMRRNLNLLQITCQNFRLINLCGQMCNHNGKTITKYLNVWECWSGKTGCAKKHKKRRSREIDEQVMCSPKLDLFITTLCESQFEIIL